MCKDILHFCVCVLILAPLLGVSPRSADAREASTTQPTSRPAGDAGLIVESGSQDWREGLIVRPKKDKDGNLPRDAVLAFLKDVAKGDVEAARAWWVDEPNPNRMKQDLRTFEEYFQELRKVDRIVVLDTGRGKKPYYWVRWQAYKDGEPVELPRPFGIGVLYLAQRDGQWRIIRHSHW